MSELAERLVISRSGVTRLVDRLESQGLLTSEWREEERRKKRFYRLSSAGAEVLERLIAEWTALNASVNNILGDKP